MKILVLGGTQFVGRHFVEAALTAGHDITLFNRGQTNPDLFGEVEKIRGDRSEDIQALDRRWEVAVDTSGYVPQTVKISANHLAERVKRYLFISSSAVYRDFSKLGIDEDDYLKTLEDPDIQEVNRSTYGPLKTECEAVVTGIFDGRDLIVRPGVLAGPHDPTDRFTYWVWRIGQGGEVLAPGNPEALIQLLDARDLGRWLVRCIEEELTGIYNATGPRMTFADMLHACCSATGSDARFTWVSPQFMNEVEIDTRQKMPLWNPAPEGRKAGMYAVDSSRALDAGLTRRPLVQTARDTWTWIDEDIAHHDWQVGLDLLEEREILAEWHGRSAR